MENNKKYIKMEYDECLIKGICSINPILSSTQAAVLVYLGALCFYMDKLHDMGVENSIIKKDILNTCYSIVSEVEYQTNDLSLSISRLYNDIYQAKGLYQKLCKEREIKAKYIKTPIKITENFNFTQALKHGQKYFAKKNSSLSDIQKNLYDMFLSVLKSIVLYIAELEMLNEDINIEYKKIVKALGYANIDHLEETQIQNFINEYITLDHELMKKTYDARKKVFGDFIKNQVPVSHVKGKAILVTGTNLAELQKLLEATKDRNINIYTHGQMICAHMFPEFKKYPHLKGHFGKGIEYAKSDFTNFPGPILLTRLAQVKTQNFFRSSIYTTDQIANLGVSKIERHNFEPLIQTALKSEGFIDEGAVKTIEVGFDENEYFEKLHEQFKLANPEKIKHIVAIGVSNKTAEQQEYFKEFFDLIDDSFLIISFSYSDPRKYSVMAEIDYGFPILYQTFDEIKKIKPLEELDIINMFTRCEPHTIANMFYLKSMGIKHIFFGGCSPNLVNPAIISAVVHRLGINIYTSPIEDYQKMTFQKEEEQ